MDDKVVLPPKYYHTNFEYLFKFVKEKYSSILNNNEWHFFRKYYSLPEDAQCLFIRFCNRKGVFFKVSNLKYAEIQDIPEQLEKLISAGFLSKLAINEHLEYLNELLSVLAKTEILKIFKLKHLNNCKREELIKEVLGNFSPEEIILSISQEAEMIVKQNFEKEVSFIQFLFFGNRFMDMTEFVLRDLGMISYYSHSDDDLVARFQTRKEAEDKWMISDQYLIFEELKTKSSCAEILNWYLNLYDSLGNLSEVAIGSFEKLGLNIGKYFEKNKEYTLAITVFKTIKRPPARERISRNMLKVGEIEAAKKICEDMIIEPLNIDEQYFAEHFIKSLEGKKNKKTTTVWLNNAEQITIDSSYKYNVELGALDYYFQEGFMGGFSENFSWRSLFGLWFWDIIFDPSMVAFHHPFQRRPSDLHLPDFFLKRERQLVDRLNEFTEPDDLLVYLRNVYAKNEGTANPFVVWMEEVWLLVCVLVHNVSMDKLKKVMIKIAENITENSRGLPDLLIWAENFYQLVEIKSPTDSLSHQQLFWLKYFNEIGINAKVLRVSFSENSFEKKDEISEMNLKRDIKDLLRES